MNKSELYDRLSVAGLVMAIVLVWLFFRGQLTDLSEVKFIYRDF